MLARAGERLAGRKVMKHKAPVVLLVLLKTGWVWAASPEESLYRRALANVVQERLEASGRLEVTVGKPVKFRFSHVVRDGRRTRIEVIEPPEFRGQRWLIVDRDGGEDKVWHFDGKTQRLAEVAQEQWRQPWLASNIALADLLFPDPEAYTFELGGEENVAGQVFTVIRLAPKEKHKDRYGVRVYSIDPRALRIVRGLFFDQQGRAVARWVVERVEEHGGGWLPAQQRFIDLTSQKASVLTLVDFKYGVPLGPEEFDSVGLSTGPTPQKK